MIAPKDKGVLTKNAANDRKRHAIRGMSALWLVEKRDVIEHLAADFITGFTVFARIHSHFSKLKALLTTA